MVEEPVAYFKIEMLAAIFTAGIIVAGAFLIRLKTKSSKRWLKDL